MMKESMKVSEEREKEYEAGVRKRNDKIQLFMDRMEKNVIQQENGKADAIY
jgi:hypothetical protein